MNGLKRARSGLSRLRLDNLGNLIRVASWAGLAAPATATLALLSAAVVLMLGGCASPGSLPEALALRPAASVGLDAGPGSEAPTVFPNTQWWRELGDPALDALVERALADQPSLAVAAARLARAAAAAESSRATQGPQVGLGLDLTRQRYAEHGLYPPVLAGKVYNSGNLQASASLELDFFGRHDAALQAAIGQQQAARADLQAARVLLAANVARSYVALARLASLRQVAERTLAQRQAMLDLTRSRVQAGLDTVVEQRQAEAGLPDARSQIEALTGQMVLARHQLAVLSGQAPQALDHWTPTSMSLLSPLRAGPLPARIGADLLGRRADVVAARWRVEAAVQDVALARTQFYPDINLVGFIGLNALGLDRLFSTGSRNLGAGPALRLPLFDGGRLRANLRGRAADADAAVAAYNGAVLDAAREVADAAASWQSLDRQQAEQAQALAISESAYDLARQRYRAGLDNYLRVLSTETGVLTQRSQHADLQARTLDAQLVLMRALGGGWRDDPPPLAAVR
jgi:NodT family efflux transporter outer membrane factor (OMF) lipoprotein